LAALHSALPATCLRCFSSQTGNPEGPPAFVFDIDGVLIRGGDVLPAAKRALAKLYHPGGALGTTKAALSMLQLQRQAWDALHKAMADGRLPPTEPCTCKRTTSHVAGETPKLPVCFLTNGGGVVEAAKAKELSGWLDVKVHKKQACTLY
jgi:Haloacid dehalogenase-like hydrolase